MNAKAILIYVTCADQEEAKIISSRLLERNLIACANIYREHLAVFQWQGEIKSETETSMILKTSENHFEDVRKQIRELHSYDCPAIVAFPVLRGDQDFIDFINSEVSEVK